MPLYPGAIKLLVPQGTVGNPAQQSKIVPRGIIVHTNASNTSIERLHDLYMPGSGYGGGEAHFQLETGVAPGSHRLAQYVDTDIRADNNYHANSFTLNGTLYGYLSIESGDLGQPYDKTFTDLGQRQQLEDLLVWMCQTHNIPAIQCADPQAPGIGWHAMWGFNTPCATGTGTYGVFTAPDGRRGCLNNPWTNTFGKICPGPGKISEMPDIIAAVAARVAGGDTSMSAQDVADLKAWMLTPAFLQPLADNVIKTLQTGGPNKITWTVPHTGGVSTEETFEVCNGYITRNCAETALATGVAQPLLDRIGKVTTDVNAHTDDAVKNIVVPAPPPPDMTKVTGHQPNQGDISFTQNP